MNKNTFKSIGAVFAGFVLILILSRVTDMILEGTGVFPSVEEQQKNGFYEGWMQWLTLAYRFAFGIVGGYVTAKLAPSKPMRHVLILAVVGALIAAIGSIVVAIKLDIFPVWYSVALVVTGFPAVYLGGKRAVK